MTDWVRINDPDQLDRLAYALERYQTGVEQAHRCAHADIAQTLGYLGERYTHWRRQHEVWRAEAEALEAKYRRCLDQASNSRGERGASAAHCEQLGAALREASRRRDIAADNVRTVDGLIRAVQQADDAYKRDSGRMHRDLEEAVPRASAALKRTAGRVRDLAAHQFSGTSLAGMATAAVAGAIFSAAQGAGSGAGTANPGGPGPHAGSPGEGATREGPPNPEGEEGTVRVPAGGEGHSTLEPPEGWEPGVDRR